MGGGAVVVVGSTAVGGGQKTKDPCSFPSELYAMRG